MYLLTLFEQSCWLHHINNLVNLQIAFLMDHSEVLGDVIFLGDGVGAKGTLVLGLDGVMLFMNDDLTFSVRDVSTRTTFEFLCAVLLLLLLRPLNAVRQVSVRFVHVHRQKTKN